MDTIKTTARQLNILLIDNDKDIVHGIEEYIKTHELKEKQGVNVEQVSNAKEALKKISEKEFNLIVLEIILPLVNGYYLLEAFKTLAPTMPVVVYSRLKGAEDLAKLSTYKVQNIFLKQLTRFDELIEAIVNQKDDPRNLDELVLELKNKLKVITNLENQVRSKITQCPKCHLVISPNSHFCNNCGQKIAKLTAPVPAKEQPVKEQSNPGEATAAPTNAKKEVKPAEVSKQAAQKEPEKPATEKPAANKASEPKENRPTRSAKNTTKALSQ
ncbi:response regulator [Candidatus Peregrinibacteria bacterium]|nr:MAG: response regulator [Candidatus Peregrinibacteria bacterium]